MNPPSYKSLAKIIASVLIGGLIFGWLAWESSPERVITQIGRDGDFACGRCTEALAKTPAYSKVTCFAYTGAVGTVFIQGSVKSENELTDLQKLILSLHPESSIRWEVKVIADAQEHNTGLKPTAPVE